jgi:hypothetical protein
MKQTAPSEPTEGHSEVTGRDFERWSPELIEESKNSGGNGQVGTRLLFESPVARIWVTVEFLQSENAPLNL